MPPKVAMEIEGKTLENKSKYVVWDDHRTRVVGSATIVVSEDPILLKEVSVQRNLRGRGVGSKLLRSIIEDYKDSEIVAKAFSSRVSWYLRHGFEVEGCSGELVEVRREPQ